MPTFAQIETSEELHRAFRLWVQQERPEHAKVQAVEDFIGWFDATS